MKTQLDKNPLSPHLQIYKWHITSLLSIANRIIGVINFLFIIMICFWILSLKFGESNYELINIFFKTEFGKFIIISICWTFCFQILNELRHLFWDFGLGYDIKTSKLIGYFIVIGSFILTTLVYYVGRNLI